jgi:hypothetical protein
MAEKQRQRPKRSGGGPWHVPVAQREVAEAGLHLDLAASEKVRADVARLAGLTALPRLEASFDVTRHGGNGLRVVGWVSATVGQICGVTLQPMENEIEEPIDVTFVPGAAWQPGGPKEVEVRLVDAPEPLIDGTVDLGALAIEFLILGIDPYPRKPDIAFEAPSAGASSAQPFAALAVLKKRRG